MGIRHVNVFVSIVFFGLAGPIVAHAAEAQRAAFKLVPAGASQTLYSWEKDRCEDEFLPDSAARAFRRADGKISFLASHRENWTMVGESLLALKAECKSVLRTSKHQGKGLGKVWIQATYTEDGERVAAIVSNDMTTELLRKGCTQTRSDKKCWVNRLIGATSTDMGQSYKLESNLQGSVATLERQLAVVAKNKHSAGVFTSSNIVKRDGGYYSFFFMQDESRQKAGNCLFKNDDPFDSAGWRGWDGKSFSVDLTQEGQGQQCSVVSPNTLPSNVRSLSYFTEEKQWVAFYRARVKKEGDDKPIPGFYYSTSPDLISWSLPERVMEVPTLPRKDSWEEIMNYPALLDPSSKSRNFDTVDGTEPILTYVVHHLNKGQGSMNRDIQFVKLRIQ